jgi:hypothetical protein
MTRLAGRRNDMRILVLCRRVPFPLTDGESLRIFNYAKHLAADHELDLVCAGDAVRRTPEVEAVSGVSRSSCRRRLQPEARVGTAPVDAFRVESYGTSFPEVAIHLARVIPFRNYDVIWASTDVVRCVPAIAASRCSTDVCDDGVLLIRRELAPLRGVLQRARLWKRLWMTRRFEQRFFAPTSACLFVSDADEQSFRAFAPGLGQRSFRTA